MGFFPKASWQHGKRPLNVIAQCGACGLYKNCHSPKMAATGTGKYPVLFVGEAPGESEDEQNEQFVGRAGLCLRDMLAQLPIDIDDCWKTNAVRCRPPRNKTEHQHIEYCRPNVIRDIKTLKPKVIIPMGMSAVQTVIGPEWGSDLGTISRWVGWCIPSAMYNAWICPTYHPSYVLRTNEDKPLVDGVIRHLRNAFDALKRPVMPLQANAMADRIEIITDPRLGALRIAKLAKKTDLVAFDYETTGLKPERPEQRIYSFSAASGCEGTWDCFSTLIDERCFDSLRQFLTNDAPKIASNLKFETRWSWNKLGVWVNRWVWDTMLTAHYQDNREAITSIKFQTYVRLGIGDYNSTVRSYIEADKKSDMGSNELNRIYKAPVKDTLRYGGIDSLVEAIIGVQQMAEMGFSYEN